MAKNSSHVRVFAYNDRNTEIVLSPHSSRNYILQVVINKTDLRVSIPIEHADMISLVAWVIERERE